LWGLINEFLTKHPEILNDSGGIDLEAIKNLPAEDFQAAMGILQQFVGPGRNLSQLQDQLGEALDSGGKGGPGGGKTGDKTGGKTGDKTGDKTGGKTGDETGGKTGDEGGGKTGDKTGGKPRGKPGDKTGGKSGGKPCK
jgi:hypothetical protein